MSPRALRKNIIFCFICSNRSKRNSFIKETVLMKRNIREAVEKYGEESFVAEWVLKLLKSLLGEIDLENQSKELREDLKDSTGQKRIRIIRRLEVVESFKNSGNNPEWMIIDVIPVIPPDLRPMVQLDGGRFATSDLNDLYRRVINRNNRLKKIIRFRSSRYHC